MEPSVAEMSFSPWQARMSEDGRKYFFNKQTQKSQWEVPSAATKEGGEYDSFAGVAPMSFEDSSSQRFHTIKARGSQKHSDCVCCCLCFGWFACFACLCVCFLCLRYGCQLRASERGIIRTLHVRSARVEGMHCPAVFAGPRVKRAFFFRLPTICDCFLVPW